MSEAEEKRSLLAGAGRIGRAERPRRFYKSAAVGEQDGSFAVLLDDRTAKTPAGKPLAVPSERLARALAEEWAGQGERLDPATMPLTRIVNSALDGVADRIEEVRADIVRHAESDLICYRAEGPEGLTARQDELWSPLLAFARGRLGARFILAEGIVHVTQDRKAIAAVDRALGGRDALALAAIHTITTLTGSAVIALAVAEGTLSPEDAWTAAHVDEDWQMNQWGRDDIALKRRALRWREMAAAGRIVAMSSG